MNTTVDPALFVSYIPLNALSAESRLNLARKSVLRSFAVGEHLFRVGDAADTALFLISGSVEIGNSDHGTLLRAGDEAACHAIAPHSPRQVGARCQQAAVVMAVDASLLDVMLAWDQSGRLEVGELAGDTPAPDGDWMIRLLQMPIFQRVPPANLQAMFLRMQEVVAEAGQLIVRQGDAGDYFYVVVEGRCMVTRDAPQRAQPMRLAELEAGSCFGEEALIGDWARNASVVMLTRGRLMRLSKQDFSALLSEPTIRRITFDEATRQVAAGQARWLDVRLPSEFQRAHLPEALNLPLYLLRLKLSLLDRATTYIAVCDTGRRSAVAMFVLGEKGYDVLLLAGGLPALSNE